VTAVLVLGLVPSQAASAHVGAAKKANGFISFPSFFTGLGQSGYASYSKSHPEAGLTASNFSQMKNYLEHLYAGVSVRESFMSDGSYYDCVTETTQPTVTALGITHIAQPPGGTSPAPIARGAATPWTTSGTNQQGVVVSCPVGTIPMRRTTLQEVARYHTLRTFLSKSGVSPSGGGGDSPHYRHAFVYDYVNNDGASSTLNVWNPKVPTSSVGEDHSLSQQWIIGGTGSQTQTAEAGWTKDPGFSTTSPVYFIYFTADDYDKTGCYNLECVGFVQENNSIALGGAVKPCCSTPGQVNDSFTQEWYQKKGDWWLVINGTYIGYYPDSVYKGGQLSKHSTLVEFGGEVNASSTNVNWPQMGSGKFASAGFEEAAYQSSIAYIGLNDVSAWASLTEETTGKGNGKPSPCYSGSLIPASGSTGPQLYFGGPGGKQPKC
jgi:hypothetical protein